MADPFLLFKCSSLDFPALFPVFVLSPVLCALGCPQQQQPPFTSLLFHCRGSGPVVLDRHRWLQPGCHHQDHVSAPGRCHCHHRSWDPSAAGPAAHGGRVPLRWPRTLAALPAEQLFKQQSAASSEPEPPQFPASLSAGESATSPEPEPPKHPPAFSRRRQV